MTPTSAVTDAISITSSVGGDTITPSSLSWSASATPQTFTVTGSTEGSRTITLVATSGDIVMGSPLVYTASVPFTVSGPTTVTAGRACTITCTPNSATTDVVLLNDDGAGGTFSPSTLTFTGSSVAQTAQYTPANYGIITLSGASSQGATFTPLIVSSYAIEADFYLDKTGKLIYVGTNSTNQTANGAPLQALITALTAVPTVKVNGNTIQLGSPRVGYDVEFHRLSGAVRLGPVDRNVECRHGELYVGDGNMEQRRRRQRPNAWYSGLGVGFDRLHDH